MCGLCQTKSCRFVHLLASHQNELRPHWQRLKAWPLPRSWLSGSWPPGIPPPRAPLSRSLSSSDVMLKTTSARAKFFSGVVGVLWSESGRAGKWLRKLPKAFLLMHSNVKYGCAASNHAHNFPF